MSCKRMETDGMRYIDGEMTSSDRAEFERHLASCETCRMSMEEFGVVGRFTSRVKIKDPVDTFWEGYWRPIYRRIERKSAWIVLIAGALMVIITAVFRGIENFGEVTIEKIAGLVFLLGLVMLFVSAVRERVHQKKTDRYKDIIR